MIDVKIGSNKRQFENISVIDENWINQQIQGLKRDGHQICVRISVNEGPVNVLLATADCSSNGGGGREATADERRVFELWERLGLKDGEIAGGKVVAFFKQLRRIID